MQGTYVQTALPRHNQQITLLVTFVQWAIIVSVQLSLNNHVKLEHMHRLKAWVILTLVSYTLYAILLLSSISS